LRRAAPVPGRSFGRRNDLAGFARIAATGVVVFIAVVVNFPVVFIIFILIDVVLVGVFLVLTNVVLVSQQCME
jgi:hypothetical protein